MPRRERFLHCRLPVSSWNPPFSAVLLDLDGCRLDSNGAHEGAALAVRRFERAPRPPWKNRWRG
ncbi:MAG TPA: hypothetical protein VKH46_02375 [Thermoanaerobaculia bacterium]|nr:hypothetical protein [Thermoanaerobaculia bacterium]